MFTVFSVRGVGRMQRKEVDFVIWHTWFKILVEWLTDVWPLVRKLFSLIQIFISVKWKFNTHFAGLFVELDKMSEKSLALREYSFWGITIIILQIWNDSRKSFMLPYPRATKLITCGTGVLGRRFATEARSVITGNRNWKHIILLYLRWNLAYVTWAISLQHPF